MNIALRSAITHQIQEYFKYYNIDYNKYQLYSFKEYDELVQSARAEYSNGWGKIIFEFEYTLPDMELVNVHINLE